MPPGCRASPGGPKALANMNAIRMRHPDPDHRRVPDEHLNRIIGETGAGWRSVEKDEDLQAAVGARSLSANGATSRRWRAGYPGTEGFSRRTDARGRDP